MRRDVDYHARAKACRAMARAAKDDLARKHFLDMAATWEGFANERDALDQALAQRASEPEQR